MVSNTKGKQFFLLVHLTLRLFPLASAPISKCFSPQFIYLLYFFILQLNFLKNLLGEDRVEKHSMVCFLISTIFIVASLLVLFCLKCINVLAV